MKAGRAYELFVRPLLFSMPPESAHDLAIRSLTLAGRFLPRKSILSKPRTLFGLTFPHPVGLAAGFDKNGVALPAWEALGFGFIEIGTVTARPQPGNPRPRIFRLPQQEALINRLGFNNDGADVVAGRLRRLQASGRWPRVPVGINIGKSKITPLENAADDYLYSFRQLSPYADYLVLNVSSPNTPGLRSLQETVALAALLRVVGQENRAAQKPLLVKLAPDLAPKDLAQIVAVCEERAVSGLVATNTTIDHSSVPAALDEDGGLSGKPLRERSTDIIRSLRALTKLPIIGSGGIFDAASAREKVEAGADLLQVYTGYIYRGPALIREIVDAL
jgi:dihydroorotate dehydrogenase